MKLLIGVLVLASMFAQTPGRLIGQYNNGYHIPPSTMSGSSVCLVGYASTCNAVIARTGTSTSPAICSIDITSNGQTIVVSDVNGVAWLNAALGSSGSVTTWTWTNPGPSESTCRVFPSGVYVQATGSGSTTFSAIIKYNQ